MTRIRKEKNRYWSKEEKIRIIKKVIYDCRSTTDVSKEEDISGGMLRNWIKKYYVLGEESLTNQRKPGNPLVKYSSKKNLSELEKLQYENMKLRIELERTKKGYMVEGDGQNKVFIPITKKNMK